MPITFAFWEKCWLRHSSDTGVSESMQFVYRFVIAAGMGTPQPCATGEIPADSTTWTCNAKVCRSVDSRGCYHDLVDEHSAFG